MGQHFERGNECAHWIFPGLGVYFLALDTTRWIPLPAVRGSTGKQMNEAAASLVQDYGKDTNLTGAARASHSLFFIQIFLGNIILRYLMRVNFPLVSVPGVFHARHYVGLERVSFLEQLVHTLRIRTLDVG